VAPIVVPGSIAAATQTKAVKIRPEIVRRIQAVDLDVVCQRLEMPADQKFDLVIGTNVFLYYGAFDQMLLRSNIALMLKPGGFLLSNDKLPDTVPQKLENSLVTSQVVGQAPEFMFSYRLR
jgi:chemotaxis methyl-accepting protein methylase